jgi:hypothetical protein
MYFSIPQALSFSIFGIPMYVISSSIFCPDTIIFNCFAERISP